MHLIPITTPILTPQDKLELVLKKHTFPHLKENDILVISSKIISVMQNRIIDLKKIKPNELAHKYAKETKLAPEFCALVMQEAEQILKAVPGGLLTIKNGISIANAGSDQSNSQAGTAILWPEKPFQTAQEVYELIKKKLNLKNLGIIINDSRCMPLRQGTIGFALSYWGFRGVEDERGKPDLFGKKMRITQRDVADMLASSANLLMGDSAEATPLVVIKNAPVHFSDNINPEEILIPHDQCLFGLNT